MRDLIFAFMLGSGESEKAALRLANSIRTFGGQFCFNPIWMLSLRSENEISEATHQKLYAIGARLITFDLEQEAINFPFAAYVTAAGIAEGLAQGNTSFLAMLATDTLVLQPTSVFLLQAGKSLGACPVHLKLLGSRMNDPLDEFWRLIYRDCQVEVEEVFPMQTIADEQLIRAYFNAGLLVVRPERGLLRGWQANFERLYHLPEYAAFYQQDELYEIFMHQAVLAGSILSTLKPAEFQQFPFEVNYPLHLHEKMPLSRRPASLEKLITCRYEDYEEGFRSNLDNLIQIDEPLKDWLKSQI